MRMLNQVSKLAKRTFSKYAREAISTNNVALFPPEQGIIKKSLHSEELRIPKCTIDQYVWENVNQWSDRTAVVSFNINKK